MTLTRALLTAAVEAKLTPESTEMILTAIESGEADHVAGKLWEKRAWIEPSSLQRLLAPRTMIRAYKTQPQTLASDEAQNHPQKQELLRLALDLIRAEHPRERHWNAEGKERAEAALAAVLHDETHHHVIAELCEWAPETLKSEKLRAHPEGPRLLREVYTRIEEGASGAHVTAFLHALAGARSEHPDEDEHLKAAYKAVLAHAKAPEVLAGAPSLLTQDVHENAEDVEKLVREVVEIVLENGYAPWRASLLAVQHPEIAEEITRALPVAGLDEVAAPDDPAALRARVVNTAARALSGNREAQEIFWGLASEWTGTVGELVETARRASNEE